MSCWQGQAPSDDFGEEYGTAADGTKLHLEVHKPAGSGPWPAVILVHGGGWVAGYRGLMRDVAAVLTANNYVAVPIDYRLAPPNVLCMDGAQGNFGDEPCQAGYNQPAPTTHDAPVADLRLAITYMRAKNYVTGFPAGKVGVMGGSAGGHIALFAAGTGVVGTTRPNCAAGISGYPDFTAFNPNPDSQAAADNYAGGSTDALRQAASPYYNVDGTAKPMFLANSEFDGLSPVSSMRNFDAKLTSLGVTHTYKELTGDGGHWKPTLNKVWPDVLAFLAANLA